MKRPQYKDQRQKAGWDWREDLVVRLVIVFFFVLITTISPNQVFLKTCGQPQYFLCSFLNRDSELADTGPSRILGVKDYALLI